MIWKPDTCDCELEYNGANSPENFVRSIKTCAKHASVSGQAHAQAVLERNQTKNKADTIIRNDFPIEPRWSYDANDKLTFDLAKELNPAQKNVLQSKIDSLLGANKVQII